jgi:hypothetical protein
VFGGYGKFGRNIQVSKTYSWTNSAHYGVKATMKFLKIDSWDSSDWVDVYLGGAVKERITSTNADGPNDECGLSSSSFFSGNVPYNEKIFFLTESHSPHTTGSVEIKFISNFDEDLTNESWGVREIFVYLSMCDTSCSSCSGPSSNQCSACQVNAQFSGGTCTCRTYYYLKDAAMPCTVDPCATCSRCHLSCRTCDGAGSNNCLSCEVQDSFENAAKTCSYPTSKFCMRGLVVNHKKIKNI